MTNRLAHHIKAYRRLAPHHKLQANLILCKAYVDAPPGSVTRHVLVGIVDAMKEYVRRFVVTQHERIGKEYATAKDIAVLSNSPSPPSSVAAKGIWFALGNSIGDEYKSTFQFYMYVHGKSLRFFLMEMAFTIPLALVEGTRVHDAHLLLNLAQSAH